MSVILRSNVLVAITVGLLSVVRYISNISAFRPICKQAADFVRIAPAPCNLRATQKRPRCDRFSSTAHRDPGSHWLTEYLALFQPSVWRWPIMRKDADFGHALIPIAHTDPGSHREADHRACTAFRAAMIKLNVSGAR